MWVLFWGVFLCVFMISFLVFFVVIVCFGGKELLDRYIDGSM